MERHNGIEPDPEGAFVYYADAQATIAALQTQLGDLTVKYKNLVAWYDKQNGTPCEQVRHQQEVEALQARVKELEESRDAWKASQECSEKAYMALVNQIPAERFDYDPVNVALLDGAKEQEIIGRKQIADLQGLLKWTDENREQWRKLCQEAQSQLTQRTAERDCVRRRVDELEAREVDVVLLREDLEKRTAELEAANHAASTHQALWREACDQRDELHAELERGRGLVRALPAYKDISVSHRIDENDYESWHVWVDHNPLAECDTEEEANAIKALYEHRQVMEG